MKFLTFFPVALLSVTAAFAEPVISDVVNTASYLRSAYPNGGIAQGSVFSVFGFGMGPETVVTPPSLPLTTSLAGVSVKVVIGTTTVDALPIVAYDEVVSAILPSSTPLGAGAVTVTFNNEPSESYPIKVVRNALGVYASQNGSGPGALTDANNAYNTIFNAANPGSTWILWGTGLGPVTGNEASGPLPGDMPNLDVKVFVGGVQAQVTYRGRSGCCAGLDQVIFTVPNNVFSCYAPVTVTVNGVPSNTVTMSIAQTGKVCSDTGGFSASELTQAQTRGSLAVASINLLRNADVSDADAPFDSGAAFFKRYTAVEFSQTQSFANVFPKGACYVYKADSSFESSGGTIPDLIEPQYLDAGENMEVRGPAGTKPMIPLDLGTYYLDLGDDAVYLQPGSYTVANGPGGETVKSFQSQLNVPANVTWTNQSSISTIPAGQPLRITWDGTTAGVVYITGFSTNIDPDTGESVGASFICTAAAADKQFSVPSYVIDSLPSSGSPDDFLSSTLGVGLFTDPVKFNATGLDVGFFNEGAIVSKAVLYHPAP